MNGILLTKKEVAILLHVSKKTIDNYCKDRRLSFIRIPAGKRFDPADIEAFIEGRKFNHLEHPVCLKNAGPRIVSGDRNRLKEKSH